jgi:uncharacterized protein (TIGR02996 family)
MIVHPDADAFITRLISSPGDTVIRHVLADWLAEQGGVGNENWSRYIRLRAEANGCYGVDRELLLEDAANVAPLISARLTLSASRLAPHFLDFLDLLPPDRINVTTSEFQGPVQSILALGEQLCRKRRVVLIAERDAQFAAVSDSSDPTLSANLGQVLSGSVVVFPTAKADLDAALDRHFPAVQAPPEVDPKSVTLEELPAKVACLQLIAAARAEHAAGIEVVAQPSNYEVRFLFEGRARRRHIFTRENGARLIHRFFELSARVGGGLLALPRNTSFGDGVSVDLRTPH